MKRLSTLGIIGGAALLTAIPISLQWSQKNVAVSLSIGSGASILTEPCSIVIIGAGQSGLATAFGLRREAVTNVVVLDRNPAGIEPSPVVIAQRNSHRRETVALMVYECPLLLASHAALAASFNPTLANWQTTLVASPCNQFQTKRCLRLRPQCFGPAEGTGEA